MGAAAKVEIKTEYGSPNKTWIAVTGPASYDTGGSVLALTTLDTVTPRNIRSVIADGVYHVDGAAYVTHYINADTTAISTGVLYYETAGAQVAGAVDLSAANKRVKLLVEWE